MELRHWLGDRAGALAEYEQFRDALLEEMSAEPMPETRALYAQVQSQNAGSARDLLAAQAVGVALASARPGPLAPQGASLCLLHAKRDPEAGPGNGDSLLAAPGRAYELVGVLQAESDSEPRPKKEQRALVTRIR